MLCASFIFASVLAVSVQDHLEGSEIGDSRQFVSFRTGGTYYAERQEKRGRTVARGKWRITGDRLDVTISSCRGPSCGTLGRPWSASVSVPAERAMVVKAHAAHAPLASGSYYCRFQGCEKRLGVEIVGHTQRPEVMERLLAFLIDKNRGREVTVVWVGSEPVAPQRETKVVWCGREGDRAREGAERVMADLRELGWVGATKVVKGAADCLYDVRVMVSDQIAVPPVP